VEELPVQLQQQPLRLPDVQDWTLYKWIQEMDSQFLQGSQLPVAVLQ